MRGTDDPARREAEDQEAESQEAEDKRKSMDKRDILKVERVTGAFRMPAREDS